MRHKHKKTYTDRLKEHIGLATEGRTDYFHLTHKQTITMIKEQLKDHFNCNLWTFEWSEDEMKFVDGELTKEGIIHCYDEIMDAFICFRTESEMKGFYDDLRENAPKERLQWLREHNVNTPVIKWYE